MKFKTILFDLDGTLLPMNNEDFTKAYIGSICKRMANHGYEPQELAKVIWNGVKAMIMNDGNTTNETLFWNEFCKFYGENAREDEPKFDEYYKTDFQTVKSVSKPCEESKIIVNTLKEKGIGIVLATNPLFPRIATESRVRWAGLEPSDFLHITTYENSCYSKPNVLYYREIIEKLNIKPEDCLMVGNDVGEDMIAAKLGMQVFLLTDYLINKNDEDISVFNKGNLKDLIDFIEK